MIRLFRKIFPNRLSLYGWIAVAALILMNAVAYYGPRLLTRSLYHYDFTTSLDMKIPFIPAFIVVYSAIGYGQWIYGYYLSACEDKKTTFFIVGAEIIAKIPSIFIFLFIPTTMARPDVVGADLFSIFIRWLYLMDTPDNLFPSFHVLESYMLLRTLPMLKKAPKWYRVLTPIVSPLVIISILFVKQHLIVDILGGIAVAEFGLLSMNVIFAALSNGSRIQMVKKHIKKTVSLSSAKE